MKNSWQLNILFMVILITKCFGGPIDPPKNITGDLSINKDLSGNSKNSEGINTVDIKPTDVDPKLDEAIEPVINSNKSAINVSNIISNINYKANSDSTTVSNKDVKEAALGTDNVPASAAAFNPLPSTAVVMIPSNPAAGLPEKPESGNQPAAGNEIVTHATVNDNTGVKITEPNAIGSEDKNETESDKTTEDLIPENNISDEPSGSLGETNVDMPIETGSEIEKVTTIKPELEKINDTKPKPEPSADPQNQTQIETQEPIVDSHSNTQTDNQKPITDVGNKIPTVAPVQTPVNVVASKSNVVASKSSTTSTPSSFSFDMDPSVSSAQSSDSDFSQFDQYTGDNDESETPYDDISEETYDYETLMDEIGSGNSYNDIDAGGIKSVDTAPYEKNDQQKLNGEFTDDTDSHFFAYFLTIMVTAIVFYLLFHNKQRVGNALGCFKKNDRLKRIKEDKAKEPLLKSSSTDA